MRRPERLDEPLRAYLLVDELEVERRYPDRDRGDLRWALLRATVCLALLCGGLAAAGALHQTRLDPPSRAGTPR
jgi:fatty acid desaturase